MDATDRVGTKTSLPLSAVFFRELDKFAPVFEVIKMMGLIQGHILRLAGCNGIAWQTN